MRLFLNEIKKNYQACNVKKLFLNKTGLYFDN